MEETENNMPLLALVPHTYIGRDGAVIHKNEPTLIEHLVDVYVNSVLTMKLICIPQHLAELILGRLHTEGIIQTAHNVKELHISADGRKAEVILANSREEVGQTDYVEIVPSSTGARVLNNRFTTGGGLKPVVPIQWTAEQVFALADCFSNGMTLHSQTWSTHSCFLARNGDLLFKCEDIGRHNALDKVIGYALRANIPLSECIVYSSGRVPTDMVTKAIRAGIPVFSSKAAPTKEAVEMAKKYNLTLVCAARCDRLKLFAGSLCE